MGLRRGLSRNLLKGGWAAAPIPAEERQFRRSQGPHLVRRRQRLSFGAASLAGPAGGRRVRLWPVFRAGEVPPFYGVVSDLTDWRFSRRKENAWLMISVYQGTRSTRGVVHDVIRSELKFRHPSCAQEFPGSSPAS